MKKLLSVIVPVYNAEKFLYKCVESIINQSYKNIEIILVDDGSTDNSPTICDELAESDSRIVVIHKENGGVSSARNAGLDAAIGDYIAFVDSDDWIDNDMYETMLSLMERTNSQIASSSIMRENGDKASVWGEIEEPYIIKSRDDVLIEISSTLGLVCIHTCNKVFEKSIIKAIRFDESLTYCEDVLFNYCVSLNMTQMVYINTPYYHFFYNILSATHNRKEYAKFNALKVQDTIGQLSPEHLSIYCIRGDVIKTFDKIKEVLTDDVCTLKEYFWLRKRITKHFKLILTSSIFSRFTKIKSVFILLFPLTFNFFNRIYGKRQLRRNTG